MDDLLSTASCAPALDVALAYADLPVGVVITDRSGLVVFANSSAEDLFSPLRPVSFGLRTLLGLSGITGAGELARAVEANAPSGPIRIGLPDGRAFEGRSKPLVHGGSVLALFDVTTYVQGAELASLDALTGLAMRTSLHQHLGALLAERQRGNASVAVLCIDLDKFKMVNDTLGHPVGDALLVKVAERLRTAARADDLVARLGGDEFAIVQANAPQPQAAEALAARLVDLIGRTYIAAGHMLTIGASVGIAVAPDDGDDVTTLLKHADLALYRAKADGRGLFRFFQRSRSTSRSCAAPIRARTRTPSSERSQRSGIVSA